MSSIFNQPEHDVITVDINPLNGKILDITGTRIKISTLSIAPNKNAIVPPPVKTNENCEKQPDIINVLPIQPETTYYEQLNSRLVYLDSFFEGDDKPCYFEDRLAFVIKILVSTKDLGGRKYY